MPLRIQDKVKLTFKIPYSIPKTRNYVKGYGFLLFARNLSNKYDKQLMDTAAKKRIRCYKNCFQKSSL